MPIGCGTCNRPLPGWYYSIGNELAHCRDCVESGQVGMTERERAAWNQLQDAHRVPALPITVRLPDPTPITVKLDRSPGVVRSDNGIEAPGPVTSKFGTKKRKTR